MKYLNTNCSSLIVIRERLFNTGGGVGKIGRRGIGFGGEQRGGS